MNMNDNNAGTFPDMPSLDYKAIIAFILVIETRSLGRAATVLGCSQSSVSMYLKRFRFMTNKHLFTRDGRELQPTTEAIHLAKTLKESITKLNEILVG